MYLLLDSKLLKKIEKITSTQYHTIANFIPVDNVVSMIEDLMNEIEYRDNRIKDIVADREDNYRPVSVAEQVGYDERDFI